jgi:hypothetical protein
MRSELWCHLSRHFYTNIILVFRGSPFLPDSDRPTPGGRTTPTVRSPTTTERVFLRVRR